MKDLIAADRNGDWNGHLQAVQDVLPLFQECDSIHYLRYGSLYLEQMRYLPNEYPDIYNKFLSGHFAVKTKQDSFNAVSPDMKLEQTIQPKPAIQPPNQLLPLPRSKKKLSKICKSNS